MCKYLNTLVITAPALAAAMHTGKNAASKFHTQQSRIYAVLLLTYFCAAAGGMFADFNVHDFDMLRFLTGATIKNIHARGGAKVCQQQDGIDTTLLSMELAGGVFASVHCCRQSGRGYDQRVEILAQKGMLFLQNRNNNAIVIANNNGKTIANPPPDFAARYKNSYQTQLRAFIAACQQLMDDLLLFYDENTGTSEQYFLGCLVIGNEFN